MPRYSHPKSPHRRYKDNLRAIAHQKTNKYGRNGDPSHHSTPKRDIKDTFQNPDNHSKSSSGFKDFAQISDNKTENNSTFLKDRNVSYNGDSDKHDEPDKKSDYEQQAIYIDEAVDQEDESIFSRLMREKKHAVNELDKAREEIYKMRSIINSNPCKYENGKWSIRKSGLCIEFEADGNKESSGTMR